MKIRFFFALRCFLISVVVLLMALLVSACGSLIETKEQAPSVEVPQYWNTSRTMASSSPALEDKWWEAYGDENLNALVEDALRQNADLATAALKVKKARLQAGLAESDQRPSLGSSSEATTTRSMGEQDKTARKYSTTATISYEVDLWNRLGSLSDAARWEAEATEQDLESTRLTLIGTTISLYWKAVYLNERLASARESLEYTRQTLALVEVQFRSGAASQLELSEAQRDLESQRATEADLVRQKTQAITALSLLFDRPPVSLEIRQTSVTSARIPTVAEGVPADVLTNRPDIKATQLRLRESVADINATRASYFPTLSLTGSAGGTSTALKDILQNPVAALGVGLVLPFLNWNEMNLKIEVSKTDYAEAVVAYRQALYQAFADVENALSDREQYGVQGDRLESALAASREVERIYAIRYGAGAVALQSWLDAQEKRRALDQNVMENRLNRLLAYSTLCQALGGGPRAAR